MMNKPLATSLAIAAFFAFGLSSAEAKTVLKAGHILSVDSPLDQSVKHWAKLIGEKSKGDIEVQVFPASQLGSVLDQLGNLTAGSQDMMVEHLEFYQNFDKRFGVLGLPYLFADRDHLGKFIRSPRFAEMLASVEQTRGIRFLAAQSPWIWSLDRTLLSRRPVFTPDDLKGLKLRMFEARVPVLSWQTLGASTIIIPWGETYTALATKTVDAITARVEAHYQMKQTEVVKYMTITKEYYQMSIPVMSAKTQAKLSAAQMKAIADASRDAAKFFDELTAKLGETLYDKVIREHGVSVIQVPVEPWQKKMQPAFATFEKEGVIPQGMIKYVQDLK